jgi:hypothetical protein
MMLEAKQSDNLVDIQGKLSEVNIGSEDIPVSEISKNEQYYSAAT